MIIQYLWSVYSLRKANLKQKSQAYVDSIRYTNGARGSVWLFLRLWLTRANPIFMLLKVVSESYHTVHGRVCLSLTRLSWSSMSRLSGCSLAIKHREDLGTLADKKPFVPRRRHLTPKLMCFIIGIDIQCRIVRF